MLVELNETIPICLTITDNYGTPILNAAPVVYIRRRSDNFYFTGSTWQSSEVSITMPRDYQHVYTYNFTPTQFDSYKILAMDVVNKISGGVVITVSKRLDNSDVKTSTRLSQSTYVSPDNTGINTKLDTININVVNGVDHLDNEIHTRATVSDIWNYSSRSLSPFNIQGIGAVALNISIDNNVTVEIYNSLKQPLFQGVSKDNNITFYVNSGEYYVAYMKNGFFTKEEKLNIPNVEVYSHSVELVPLINVENLNIKFRELSSSTVYVNDNVKLQIELYETSGKSFNISSVSASDGTNNYTTTFSGNRVFVQFNPSQSGVYKIDVDVTIGGFVYSYLITKKVI